MKNKLIWSIFWILVLDFMFLLVNSTIPAAAQWSNNHTPMFLPVLVFALLFLLGIVLLLVLTLTGKVGGLLKRFLLLTACAPIVIPIGFALPEAIANYVLYAIMLAFLVGAIGSIVLKFWLAKKL